MADDGFDPCECIWNQQAAMRRLMAFLRQSQSYCTDTECFDEAPGPDRNNEGDLFLMTFIALALAFYLIVFRPQNTRNQIGDVAKQRDGEPDDSAPPPMI